MFELNDNLDIKIAKDIGPQKRSAIIIDNFYKNPDEIRELALQQSVDGNRELCGGLPGTRIFVDTMEVQQNLSALLTDLCFDINIWGRAPKYIPFQEELSNLRFLVNVVNDETLLKHPTGIIPHQDFYEDVPYDIHLNSEFGAVIYLNTPEECAGGTSLYSLNGEMTVPRIDNPHIPVIQMD